MPRFFFLDILKQYVVSDSEKNSKCIMLILRQVHNIIIIQRESNERSSSLCDQTYQITYRRFYINVRL